MCGIAGIYSPEGDVAGGIAGRLRPMVASLTHRGPDGEGFWYDDSGSVGLGQRRLAIVDLSETGKQPMVSADGRYTITVNGEIYNYVEMRRDLQRDSVVLRGTSDTEVLLEAIARWGLERTLTRAVGMWAFALWDSQRRALTLSRDRAGKKPLQYLLRESDVYFASELKALRTLPGFDATHDEESIYHYLTFGFVPAPRTIYANVQEVPPAGLVTFERGGGPPTTRRYWQFRPSSDSRCSFNDAVDHADELLRDAVAVRLRADVPVGCFLSGGIDSGLIAAHAARELTTPLKTFTVSTAPSSMDEAPLAKLVADRYSTEHHVLVIEPDVRALIPEIVRAYDEPLADASVLPTYCIAREARKHVKVVLNGEGADEVFAGYRRYLATKMMSRLAPALRAVPRSAWDRGVAMLPVPAAYRSRYAFMHRFLRGAKLDPFEQYIAWCLDGFNETEKAAALRDGAGPDGDSVQVVESVARRLAGFGSLPLCDKFMALDFAFQLHDDMLVKVDIATMAHGLEARCPFLDHRLIDWAYGLPQGVRLRGWRNKPILRALARRHLPAAVASAPKRGFELPLVDWLRNDLAAYTRETLLDSSGLVSSLFSRKYLEALVAEKVELDAARWADRLWKLLILAVWDDCR